MITDDIVEALRRLVSVAKSEIEEYGFNEEYHPLYKDYVNAVYVLKMYDEVGKKTL